MISLRNAYQLALKGTCLWTDCLLPTEDGGTAGDEFSWISPLIDNIMTISHRPKTNHYIADLCKKRES